MWEARTDVRDCKESWDLSRRLPRLLRIRPLRLTISEFGGLRLKLETVEFPDSEETPDVTSGL